MSDLPASRQSAYWTNHSDWLTEQPGFQSSRMAVVAGYSAGLTRGAGWESHARNPDHKFRTHGLGNGAARRHLPVRLLRSWLGCSWSQPPPRGPRVRRLENHTSWRTSRLHPETRTRLDQGWILAGLLPHYPARRHSCWQ